MDREVIYKYELSNGDLDRTTEIRLPVDATPLHVAHQGDKCYIWIKHWEESERYRTRRFLTISTGEPIVNLGMPYIGTILAGDGNVWHIFEMVG